MFIVDKLALMWLYHATEGYTIDPTEGIEDDDDG